MNIEDWLPYTFLNGGNGDLSSELSKFISNYLKVNVWTFLIHLICAVIIMACITAWVWKPTCDFIETNRKKLDKERNELVLNTKETKYFLGLLKRERNELFNLRRSVEMEAKSEADRILIAAKEIAEKSAEKMRQEAEDRVRIMEEKAKEQIKEAVVDLSLELTEKLIAANINDQNNKAIIDAYIKEIEDKNIASTKLS